MALMSSWTSGAIQVPVNDALTVGVVVGVIAAGTKSSTTKINYGFPRIRRKRAGMFGRNKIEVLMDGSRELTPVQVFGLIKEMDLRTQEATVWPWPTRQPSVLI
jgi:hypothetical protein